MRLIVVSGRSGSGKSTALAALEDLGYQCIDNLPVSLLRPLARTAASVDRDTPFAVSIDARNLPQELDRFPQILDELRTDGAAHAIEIVYLDADPVTLVRRFSETRRRHPLSGRERSLQEALAAELEVLAGIAERADLRLDTTEMTVHTLRETIRRRVSQRPRTGLSLMFQSFGFGRGVPVDADFVFDVRCLPNPHWEPALRPLTGRDAAVMDWLAGNPDVGAMEDDLARHLGRWLPSFLAGNRSYLTVAVGCTGGRHRSVYLAERLATRFGTTGEAVGDVLVRHRELARMGAA